MKIAIAGCGLRTPLLIHGLVRSGLEISQIDLYDIDSAASTVMAGICQSVVSGTPVQIRAVGDVETAAGNCAFFISSIRVGGMARRALDERLAVKHGYAGQETTGPAGCAMALRTVPVSIEHARIVSQVAPRAWIINFTNPAGLITQAISTYTTARVAGICDTPAELFWQIAEALHEPLSDVECDYIGLNHLGWVRKVRVRGQDVTDRLMADDAALRRLYPAELFSPELIRALGLIPSEYLFFYYANRTALHNQLAAAKTRGEELVSLNDGIWQELTSQNPTAALITYRAYLNRRNASYMRLEGAAESGFVRPDLDADPFESATGYHRIAVEAIRALQGKLKRKTDRVVLNVSNHGTIPELEAEDVIEAPCVFDGPAPRPLPAGPLPDRIRGLVLAVKTSERHVIQAAVEKSRSLAALSLLLNPIVGEWREAREFIDELVESDPIHLGSFST